MRTLPLPVAAWLGAVGAAGAVAIASFASADETPAAPCVTRADVLPARSAWVDRQVDVPAVTEQRCVPVFETVKVPVFEERRVPMTREVEVPVTATREVPVFADRNVPEMGPVEVPILEQRRRPVHLTLPNPFGCDDLDIKLWDRCETVACGTRVEQGVVGWHTERVPAGTRAETYVAGTRKQTIPDGERCETVKVGERDETRQVGFRTETVVLAPARTETVRECVSLPAERVTVVTQGEVANARLEPGTTRALTDEQFRREIADAR
jgi:hypothetical protein